MGHSKCSACMARIWRDGDPAEHLGDLCPGCGGELEPIRDLNALVGLRCLRARPRFARRLRAPAPTARPPGPARRGGWT
jgi:hypothetical protein